MILLSIKTSTVLIFLHCSLAYWSQVSFKRVVQEPVYVRPRIFVYLPSNEVPFCVQLVRESWKPEYVPSALSAVQESNLFRLINF